MTGNNKTDFSNAFASLIEGSAIQPNMVKPLDSVFGSVAELLFSWTNSQGYEKCEEKGLDASLARACCEALGIKWVQLNTEQFMHQKTYFKSDEFIKLFLAKHNYRCKSGGGHYLVDEGNRVVSIIGLSACSTHNLEISFLGSEVLGLELLDLMRENVAVDPHTDGRTTYHEVVKGGGGMIAMMSPGGGDGAGELKMVSGTIDKPRVALPEYYPSLGGTVHELFAKFMASEESVLVLMGPPGTGKTSAVSAAIDLLNLMPIYAKRTEVIGDINFVDFVFKTSDRFMNKVGNTAERLRTDLFGETTMPENHLTREKMKAINELGDVSGKVSPRVPMIICEDADLLLRPRSAGNVSMGNLLNETDGISSNVTRKIVFLTNLKNEKQIDEALLREGRCFHVVHFHLLTPEQAVAARKAGGLPDFKEMPTEPMSLAAALRKPRKDIKIIDGVVVVDGVKAE